MFKTETKTDRYTKIVMLFADRQTANILASRAAMTANATSKSSKYP